MAKQETNQEFLARNKAARDRIATVTRGSNLENPAVRKRELAAREEYLAGKAARENKPVIKINTNPNKTPAKGMSKQVLSGQTPRPGEKVDRSGTAFTSRTGNVKVVPANPEARTPKNTTPTRTSNLRGREVGKMDHQGGHGLSGGSTGGNSSGVNIKYSK